MMKKLLCSILLCIGLLAPIAVTSTAGAVNVFQVCQHGGGSSEFCKEQNSGNTNPIIKDIKIALDILSIIAGFGAVVMGIIGGIRLIMSNGDPASVKSGREAITYALIGVVIVIFAQSIVAFVLSKVG